MFRPVDDICLACGRTVDLMEAQQLVLDKEGEWHREHQRCFDTERQQQEMMRRQNAIIHSDAA